MKLYEQLIMRSPAEIVRAKVAEGGSKAIAKEATCC
jgi:hypothetical protein